MREDRSDMSDEEAFSRVKIAETMAASDDLSERTLGLAELQSALEKGKFSEELLIHVIEKKQ